MVFFGGKFSQLGDKKMEAAKGTKGFSWKKWAQVATSARGKKVRNRQV
jgi:hypothetical protein